MPTPLRERTTTPDVCRASPRRRGDRAAWCGRATLVILESTSPVGTTEGVVAGGLRTAGHAVGEDVFVAHCPERVLPGRILVELIENDRIVGGINEASTDAAAAFYGEFVRGEVLETNAAHRRVHQAGREHLPRRQHRLRQRAVDDLPRPGAIDVWELIAPRQPPPARQHPAARAPASAATASPSIRGSSSPRTRRRRA